MPDCKELNISLRRMPGLPLIALTGQDGTEPSSSLQTCALFTGASPLSRREEEGRILKTGTAELVNPAARRTFVT